MATMRVGLSLRTAVLSDVPALLEVQSEAHTPEFWESSEAFGSYVALGHSRVVLCGERVVAYALMAPWDGKIWPCLNSGACAAGEHLWWHDMAILEDYRGCGIVDQLLLDMTTRYEKVGGIALGHVVEYWLKRGFGIQDDVYVHPCYGPGAKAMLYEA